MHSSYICFLWLKVFWKSWYCIHLVLWWIFQIYTWDSLPFKPISHLYMVFYYQNLIRRTLGLTISPFFMMKNLGYLREEKNLPLKPIMDQSIKIYECKTKIIRTCEFSIGNNVNHENSISYIYIYTHTYSKVKCTWNINI